MADELSEERRRLIYRYMQETGTADQPTLPSPLPEEVMATADQPRTSPSMLRSRREQPLRSGSKGSSICTACRPMNG
jgi:hypothetical protein